MKAQSNISKRAKSRVTTKHVGSFFPGGIESPKFREGLAEGVAHRLLVEWQMCVAIGNCEICWGFIVSDEFIQNISCRWSQCFCFLSGSLCPYGKLASSSRKVVHSSKLTWQWKITMFNREYIFNRSIFHCHVSCWYRAVVPVYFTQKRSNPCKKCYGMDCFGTHFTHVQTCNVTRVESATEWTASVHTSHMSKPVM